MKGIPGLVTRSTNRVFGHGISRGSRAAAAFKWTSNRRVRKSHAKATSDTSATDPSSRERPTRSRHKIGEQLVAVPRQPDAVAARGCREPYEDFQFSVRQELLGAGRQHVAAANRLQEYPLRQIVGQIEFPIKHSPDGLQDFCGSMLFADVAQRTGLNRALCAGEC
jgi:hypothetical protein